MPSSTCGTICSLDSGSYNDTISDQPGAGRTVGKFYDRVGASLENLIYKAVAKKRSMSSNLNKSRSIGESLGGTTYNGAGPSSTTVFTQPTLAESACSLATLGEESEYCSSLSSGSRRDDAESICSCDARSSSDATASSSSSDSYTTIYTLCSTETSTNATSSNLIGPGRVLGLAYSALGRAFEAKLNHLATKHGLGPNGIASQIRQMLRRPLHDNFLGHLDDLQYEVTLRLMGKCTALVSKATKFSSVSF